MRRRVGSLILVLTILPLVSACGGNPPPEPMDPPPPPPPPPAAAPDDSARREAEASRLCDRARAAMEAGNYATARELLRQVMREYPGTECARTAPAQIERADALDAITARIHFEFNLAQITDEAAAVLQRKAEALRAHPGIQLTIQGHCDERGSLEYNQALGMRRAQAARDYLTRLGIDGSRLRTVSFGEERPLVAASNEAAWGQNRRDEFVITAGEI